MSRDAPRVALHYDESRLGEPLAIWKQSQDGAHEPQTVCSKRSAIVRVCSRRICPRAIEVTRRLQATVSVLSKHGPAVLGTSVGVLVAGAVVYFMIFALWPLLKIAWYALTVPSSDRFVSLWF